MGWRRTMVVGTALVAAAGCRATVGAERADLEIYNPCFHQQVVRLWTGYVPVVAHRAGKEIHIVPARETMLIPDGFPPGLDEDPDVYYVEMIGLGRRVKVVELEPTDEPLEFSIPRVTCAVGRGG